MFTRIPKAWSTFTIDPYKTDTVRPTAAKRNTARWAMVLDSLPKTTESAAKKLLAQDLPNRLIGEMSVQPVAADWKIGDSRTTREDASISLLRQFIAAESTKLQAFGDPVKAFLDGNPDAEVISYSEFSSAKTGLRGLHLRMNFKLDTNDHWVTIDQRILVDRSTDKLYRLVLKCESSCFKQNYALAKRISDSWTVRK